MQVLAMIHSVDISAAGLDDYGKRTDYMKRNLTRSVTVTVPVMYLVIYAYLHYMALPNFRWCKQYEQTKTREIPAMDFLIQYLQDNLPKTERCTVVHGDFRSVHQIRVTQS